MNISNANTTQATHNGQNNNTDQHLINALLITFGFVLVFFAVLFFGYRAGSDLAHKHNYQDCIAEGRTDCDRQ